MMVNIFFLKIVTLNLSCRTTEYIQNFSRETLTEHYFFNDTHTMSDYTASNVQGC